MEVQFSTKNEILRKLVLSFHKVKLDTARLSTKSYFIISFSHQHAVVNASRGVYLPSHLNKRLGSYDVVF